MTVVLGFILAAVVGWFGCYLLKVLLWKERALAALDVAKLYAMCYFKFKAEPDCPNCKGDGFILDPIFIQPCLICHKDVTEVFVVDGELTTTKSQPPSS